VQIDGEVTYASPWPWYVQQSNDEVVVPMHNWDPINFNAIKETEAPENDNNAEVNEKD